MATTEPASAVIVRVPLPSRLARLRAERDWAASVGVPPHVTVLFPFLPARLLAAAVRRDLADIGRGIDAFDVRFERVARFPGVVYLAPEPAEPFAALTEAVHQHFPDCPPYGGAFDVVVPHLTITELVDVIDEGVLDTVATRAAAELPVGVRVSALEVIAERDDGRWHPLWRLSLGADSRVDRR